VGVQVPPFALLCSCNFKELPIIEIRGVQLGVQLSQFSQLVGALRAQVIPIVPFRRLARLSPEHMALIDR
jgi:hypothetical protein